MTGGLRIDGAPHYAQVNGIRVAYDCAGDGFPLVALHGFPRNRKVWSKLTPLLTSRFTVLAPDRRGYGDSDRPTAPALYDNATMAQDVLQLVDQMGWERFALLGHDKGAPTAQRLAVDQPDRVPKVLVLDDYEGFAASVPSYAEMQARAQIVIMRTKLDDAALADALRDVPILLPVRERTKLDDKTLALAPALKFIAQTGAGLGHLDLAAATRRKVAVCTTGSDAGDSTIELTMALILASLRRIPLIDRKMRTEAWPAIHGYGLAGKTVGVVGLGRIGTEVARLCLAFNARVLATGKTLTDERARAAGVTRVTLEALLRESDVVTVHARSNEETRGLIDDEEIALMKPGAFLINTARGPIVSEAALVRALERGALGGVGLDVFDEEPLPFEHPLRRFDNAILLPHRGYATVEVLKERFERAMRNIVSYLDGKPLQLLNPEALSAS